MSQPSAGPHTQTHTRQARSGRSPVSQAARAMLSVRPPVHYHHSLSLRFSPTPPSLSTEMKPSVGISSLSPTSNPAFHPASFINWDSAVNSFRRLLRRFCVFTFYIIALHSVWLQTSIVHVKRTRERSLLFSFSVTWNVKNSIFIYLYLLIKPYF